MEGPSDELVLKKIYFETHKRLPEEDGIDIIVIRGIGFKVYLDIAKAMKHPVRVVKDNDGDYPRNIVAWLNQDYGDCDFIKCLSPTDSAHYSLEPALIAANCSTADGMDVLAEVMLSTQTFNQYKACGEFDKKKAFFEGWYAAKDSGSKKVDSAIRIFDSSVSIEYPDYLMKALIFDS